MARFINISLDKRGITCVARLLDEAAPRTCEAVWNSLPLGSDMLATSSHGYSTAEQPHQNARIVDLALFYERNNLLLNPDYGFVPGNVFATIVEGLPPAGRGIPGPRKRGVEGETLSFRRKD